MKEVISLADFEKSRSQYLQEKNNCESANNEILSTVMQITRLNQTILDLESQKLEQTTQQRNELKENYEILLARLLDWEKAYLLKAPVNGQITFTHFWKNNQNIKVGDAVYTIIPTGSKSFIGKIQVPIQSSGKVRVGQNVIIKLDDFPYMEFGLLQGKITKISLVPDNDFYSAEIIFPSTLITTYGKNISLKNVLKGNCEIIIRNQPLILKFLYPLKALIDRGKLK